MISLKCGNCGIEYNLTIENVASMKASAKCPNCGAEMPKEFAGALGDLSKALQTRADSWKVCVSNFEPKNQEVKVEGYLTLH